MIVVVILLASTITFECHGYVHMNSMKMYEQTTLKNDSFFGFSIAYQPGIKRLIMTAPHENDMGQVYTTGLNSSNIVKVPLHPKFYRHENIMNDFWLGAAVKANSDFFITCAPRYAEKKTHKIDAKTRRSSGTSGCCFLYKYSDADNYNPIKYNYLNTGDRNKDITTFGDQMDSIGWSIEYVAEYDQTLIGSPAMMIGSIIIEK